jgi:hypothetical protein
MYCYPQYGVAASGYDGQYYGTQQNQYQSTYQQPQATTGKTAYKSKTGKSDPSPQQDVSAASAAYQQPGSVDASKANSNSTDSLKGLKKTTFPLKPTGRATSYQNHGDKAAYPLSGSHAFLDKTQKLSAGNPTSTASNPKTKVQSMNQNSDLSF